MALFLASRKAVLYSKAAASAGSVPLHTLKLTSFRNGKFGLGLVNVVANFRTGGLGKDTPHETPPMRHGGSGLDHVPQLNIDAAGVSSTDADCDEFVEGVSSDSKEEAVASHHGRHHVRKQDELMEKALLNTLTFSTKIYDTLTLPIYAAIQQPWKKLAASNAPKGVLLDKEKMIYGTLTPIGQLHKEIVDHNVTTMDKVFDHATAKHGERNCLGTRDIISEVDDLDTQTGKMAKKYELGDYKWISYRDTDIFATHLCAGFASLGIPPKGKIAVLAETRQEWMLTAMAAFKRNIQIVTVFTTLGDDGVIHALNETDVSCLVTTEEMLSRCESILKQVPSVKTVIYMDSKNKNFVGANNETLQNNVNLIGFNELMTIGEKAPVEEVRPTSKNDKAIIMYTSGSTGTPKGVILSHGNLVSGMVSVLDVLAMHGASDEMDAYIAYLPLAHVFELMSEAICFIQGIRIGYSSPLTMTDQSLAVKPGTLGDASVLKPTIMAGVPLVLERICKGIQTKVADKGRLAQLMFQFFLKYKTEWIQKGYDTPIVNKVFFEKIRSVVGGRVRFMAVGSAPLAPETHEFIRTVLCCPVCLGYAMTESSSCGTFSIAHDLTVGRVGPPVRSNNIRLIDWKEGGYRTTDKPYPRGEILMGGDNIALGYYKNSDCTDIFEEDGKRWIQTGDIGEVHPDGSFKIIDRKKDLVKLSNGEYVSLGKIEAVIKSCVFIENACVCADSTHSYPVALVVPSQNQVLDLARELGIEASSYDALCRNPVIEKNVLEELQETGRQLNLNKWEIPKKLRLFPEPWLPQSGLVTAAFKIRRNNLYKHYEREIAQMYNSS